MAEFTIKGVTYRSDKMAGLTQINVGRRAAPIFKPLFSGVMGGFTPDVAENIIDALSELEDEKLHYILEKTLSVVERKQDDARWAPIKSSSGLHFMFDDIAKNGALMLAICTRVLMDNFQDFLLDAPEMFNFGGE